MSRNMKKRQDQIMEEIKRKKFITILDLVDILHYSESTVKRDLIHLEKDGLIRRTRGGAIFVDEEKVDIPYLLKINAFQHDEKKSIIAKKCESLIEDDMVLFIDSSSTCLHLVDILKKFKGIQIITNGLMSAFVFSERTPASVYCIGGKIESKKLTINSPKAHSDIENYSADLSFISCRGCNLLQGATELTEGESYIKRGFRKQSQRVALLVDSEKIETSFMHKSLDFQDIDYVVSDGEFSETWQHDFMKKDVKIIE